MGLNGMQIAYGAESVHNALEKALLVFETTRKIEREYTVYRELLQEIPDYLALQAFDGSITYHNGDKNRTEFDASSNNLIRPRSLTGRGISNLKWITPFGP
jgi:hypothetical protein